MAYRIMEPALRLLYGARVKKCLEKIPYVRRLYRGWMRRHPFDVFYGVDTSGFMPAEQIHPDASVNRLISPYIGSQPAIVRTALRALPEPQDYSFIDMGCGKGRVLIVASEFTFHTITGVELSSDLAQVARENALKVRERFPERPSIVIAQENAITFPLPEGKLVLFIYHAFGRDYIARLLAAIESTVQASSLEHVFIVYYNPVWSEVFDHSRALTRWYAETIPYDNTEIGYGADTEDTVVIWQSRKGAYPAMHPHADRPVIITKALWRLLYRKLTHRISARVLKWPLSDATHHRRATIRRRNCACGRR